MSRRVEENELLSLSEALEKMVPEELFGDMATLRQRADLRYLATGRPVTKGIVRTVGVIPLTGMAIGAL